MDAFYLALLLYMLAVVLAAVDLFVPSGGMLLLLAGLSGFGSILFGFRSSLAMGMAMLTIVAASIPIFVVAAIKIWPHTPIGRRIILNPPQLRRTAEEKDPLHELVGMVVMTETALMPTGQLRFGHRRINALAESGWIDAGQRVKVIAFRERNLVVRTTLDPLSPAPEKTASRQVAAERTQTETLPGPAASEASLLDLPADQLGLDSIEEN